MRKLEKGFTLIELLVVIAIIGILSSVVLASLNTARQKARDAKRVTDIKQIQLALELYFDSNGKFPGALTNANDLAPVYISTIPTPPTGVSGVTAYAYVPLNSTCNSYHLGSALELSNNTVLSSDSDATAGTVASGGSCGSAISATADFNGATAICNTGAGPDQCF